MSLFTDPIQNLQIFHLLSNFGIRDLIDVVIISIFTYTVLIWFWKTTSRFVFIGIIILGVVYIVARQLQLYLTVYLLQGFFAILLIALVVIFQEDVRLFFERLATWGFMKKRKQAVHAYQVTDVLSQTIPALVKKRYGALVVLRGNDHLERHLKGGTPLDGKLSGPLLESLFDPHSDGHDGAVIIEDGRISKFGCHLPLSLDGEKIGNYGLRHTAAIGLTERSDALCIVVSEERESASIAQEGVLRKLENMEQLRDAIRQFYRRPAPEKGGWSFRRWIRENTWQKVIAAVLSLGLWIVFTTPGESIRKDFDVPLVYRNLPADWILEEPVPKESRVTLEGGAQAFSLINPESLKIVLDMADIREGKQYVVLQENQIRLPSNLSLVRFEPRRIPLSAKKLGPMEGVVKVQTSGDLPGGLVLKQITARPEIVTVLAPVNGKKSVRVLTEPVNLAEIRTTTTVRPKLVLPPDARFAESAPPVVEVTVEVAAAGT
jgi:uncharacterized protein (TIGR00159 family)